MPAFHNCLSLDSERWRDLAHAYGSGEEIPKWLRAIEQGEIDASTASPPLAEVVVEEGQKATFAYPRFAPSQIGDVCSALCHQGDFYSGAFAAVPHMVRIADAAAPEVRMQLLLCVGSCNAMRRSAHPPQDLEMAYFQAIEIARDRIVGLFPSCRCEVEAQMLLASLCGVLGCEQLFWSIGDMSYDRTQIYCPKCEHLFELVASGDSFELVIGLVDSVDIEIVHSPRADLTKAHALACESAVHWLPEFSRIAGQRALARRFELLLEGRVACPTCGHGFVPWYHVLPDSFEDGQRAGL